MYLYEFVQWCNVLSAARPSLQHLETGFSSVIVQFAGPPPHTFTFHTDVLRQGRIHPIIPGDGEGLLFHFSGSDTCCFQVKKLIMWDHLGSSGRLSARARADYSNGRWAPRSLQIKEEHTSTSETSETRLQVSFQKPVFQRWPLVIRSQAQHGATSLAGSMSPWAEILL